MAFKSTRKSRRHRTPRQENSTEKDAFFQPLQSRSPDPVQPKLTVGAPDDKYEREADSVADRVVSKNTMGESPAIQSKADSRMEKDREIQEKPDKGARAQVQRKVEGEEEPLQAKSAEEEEPVQMMSEEEEPVQAMAEEEEPVQAMEEEEPVQAKSKAVPAAGPGLASRLRSRAGKGRQLGGQAREKMESGFGRDFSGVNVHTDAAADEMNREIGARAFARGQDVYFKSGEYNPDTTAGQRLLAHELTHTVQQGGGSKKGNDSPTVQRNWDKTTGSPTFQKTTIHVKVKLRFKGAVLNKSGKPGVNTTGLAAAAKSQIEQTYKGKISKTFMGVGIVYDVSTDASVRSIARLSDLSFGKEHIIVVLDRNHPKVKGTYGRGPFHGSIVYLNEKHIGGMISGADVNTIPHEVGHTAGLKHLMEKGEESSMIGQAIKRIHEMVNPNNMMWRGGGHPSYSAADSDQKLKETNSEQLEKVSDNITDGKLNNINVFSFLDLMKL